MNLGKMRSQIVEKKRSEWPLNPFHSCILTKTHSTHLHKLTCNRFFLLTLEFFFFLYSLCCHIDSVEKENHFKFLVTVLTKVNLLYFYDKIEMFSLSDTIICIQNMINTHAKRRKKTVHTSFSLSPLSRTRSCVAGQ